MPWIRSILAELIEPLSNGVPQYFKRTWRAPFLKSQWVRSAFGLQNLDVLSRFHRSVCIAEHTAEWSHIKEELSAGHTKPLVQNGWVWA